MKKNTKILAIFTLLSLLATGCTNTSDAIVQNQNSEIIQLQQIRAQILARETKTALELKTKEADLNLINKQIQQAMETAKDAQNLSNQQNSQKVKNAVGIGATLLGGAAVIHQLTQ